MKRLLQTALLCTVAGASVAHADCKDDLDKAQERARKLQVDDDFRQQLRQLYKSALLLEKNDKSELCEDVAEAMENMVDKRQKVLQKQARKRALRNAPPITTLDRVIDLESLKDATVYDPKGEELGTLNAVIVAPGQGKVAYVVLTYGGFLGFGEKQIPVPFQKLHMTQERGSLVLDIDRDVLDEAKGIDGAPWPLHPPMPGEKPGKATQQ